MTRRQIVAWAGAVLGVFVLGCSQMQSPVEVPQQGVYKSCLGDGRDIGPEGGTVSSGLYTLTIPPGALSSVQHITLEQERCGEWPVRLGPEGTAFVLPATLAFDASGEPDPSSMTVAWWNPSTQIWVDQVTSYEGEEVSVKISHFSRFILH